MTANEGVAGVREGAPTRRAQRTRTRILDAAQELVLRRGFAATSVDAIQEAAGISRGTFFYHFATKDELSRALIRRYAETDRALTEEYMERAEQLVRDPLQQLLVFLGLHEELFRDVDEAYPGCLFASYSYEAGLFDEETQRLVEESVDRWRAFVGAKIREVIEARPPRRAVDPLVLADLAYGVFQGAFILSRVQGNPRVVLEHLEELKNYFELLFEAAPRDG